ncbi:DUF2971 domain-containing protein [Pseudomonas putida]|uniref:DUF2971 domain-containing protein n=1 Tax=Pseudomonas putida TaxID=303 RepID=UPI000281E35F|nr:DUF2971 domain-containing protein [Pseudomonas putida]EMR47955.1 hypothetical protein PPUTLS46_008934 [Pseudomonas putida LS46]
MLLYKYRSAMGSAENDNTRRIFSSSSLYYAKASTFNDPFDAQVNVEPNSTQAEAIDRHWLILRERARGRGGFIDSVQGTHSNAKFNIERIYDKVQNDTYIDHNRYYRDMIDSFGIVSLAENPDNLLLWAHYASNHYGMCLGFEWDETGLPPAEEVIYQNRYRTLEYYSHTEAELAAISLLQKSTDWAYEREWRSVAKPQLEYVNKLRADEHYEKELMELRSNPDHASYYSEENLKEKYTFLEGKVKVEGSGPKAFAQSALKEVVFGMRMSQSDVEDHINAIESYGFKPKFFQARKNPKRYQVDIHEL